MDLSPAGVDLPAPSAWASFRMRLAARAVALLCLSVGCNEPAVGIPIKEGAQASPVAPTVDAVPLEAGGVRITQTDRPTAPSLGEPATQEALEGAWLPLMDLNPKDREGLVQVFNQTPAPCGPCQRESIGRCLVALPPRCENLPILADRAIRLTQRRATLPEVQRAMSYGDMWVPIPEMDRPVEDIEGGGIPVHIWGDPAAPSLVTVVGTLDSLDLRGASIVFHFLPNPADPVSLAVARGAAAARQQGVLEGYLRGIIAVRAQSGVKGQRTDLDGDQLSLVAVGLQQHGLNIEQWEEDRASGAVRALIDEDLAVGAQVGVRAAPTWFIDGYRLRGAQSVHALQGVLDRAREDRSAGTAPSGPPPTKGH